MGRRLDRLERSLSAGSELSADEMDREILRMLGEMAAGEQRPVEELRVELLAEDLARPHGR